MLSLILSIVSKLSSQFKNVFFLELLIIFYSQIKVLTFISFYVIVPVLPQHISSISPIISGAYRFYTRILSLLYILMTLNANEIPIVNGRPSGIATTTNTTIKLIIFGNSDRS
jgi:hypothetical protein